MYALPGNKTRGIIGFRSCPLGLPEPGQAVAVPAVMELSEPEPAVAVPAVMELSEPGQVSERVFLTLPV